MTNVTERNWCVYVFLCLSECVCITVCGYLCVCEAPMSQLFLGILHIYNKCLQLLLLCTFSGHLDLEALGTGPPQTQT